MDRRYCHFDRRMTQVHETWVYMHLDCRHALFNYLVHGWDPGGFLTAVLENNLYAAASKADMENIKNIAYVTLWVLHALPPACYGSSRIVNAWYLRSDRQREETLIAAGLLPTLFEVIKDPDAELTPTK